MTQAEYNKLRTACLANARALLTAAKTHTKPSERHIAYHLGVLALEEIGKTTMAGMQLVAEPRVEEERRLNFDYEDHEAKLFWAMWGASFGRELITKKSMQSLFDLRTSIHNKRLESLYVDVDNPTDVAATVSADELDNLLRLTEARLGMEQASKGIDVESAKLEGDDAAAFEWFMGSTKNPEDKAILLSGESNRKLVEFKGDAKSWINWLYSERQKIDAKAKQLVGQEMSRQKPNKTEAGKPKWRMKVKIISESHSIRPKALGQWNKDINGLKLQAGQKDKRELVLEFTMPKAIPVNGIYQAGLTQSKLFVGAMNIATRGFFWWHIPRDTSKYYDELEDLDSGDPNYRVDVGVNPKLEVNWQEQHLVLGQNELGSTAMVYAFLAGLKDKAKTDAVSVYISGISLLAKSDIHLRLEPNAFGQFMAAFKQAVAAFGDKKPGEDVYDTLRRVIPKELHESLERCIELDQQLPAVNSTEPAPAITLTDVYAAKIMCEYYLAIKAKAWADKRRPKQDKKSVKKR
jgi:AbiV family abortive infection protein